MTNKSTNYIATNFIAVDPGREKTGLAILSFSGEILEHKIINSEKLVEEVQALQSKYKMQVLIIGSGTSSKAKQKLLQKNFSELRIIVVDEYRSTDQARKLYFEANPPKGWKRLLPIGMQVPSVPIDDYAAIVIGKRFLAKYNNYYWTESFGNMK